MMNLDTSHRTVQDVAEAFVAQAHGIYDADWTKANFTATDFRTSLNVFDSKQEVVSPERPGSAHAEQHCCRRSVVTTAVISGTW
jgi:hypothetical protein